MRAPTYQIKIGRKRDEIIAMVGKMHKAATKQKLFVPTDSYPLNGYVSKLLDLHKTLENLYEEYQFGKKWMVQ